MADSFKESVQQAQNKNTLSEDAANSQWEDGDNCGEKGCTHEVHRVDHSRNPQIGAPRHPDAPETEFVCTHHGIVASR